MKPNISLLIPGVPLERIAGINRTMAQIHALLLVSPDPLSQDDIMEQLSVSRGNVNMNIRDLIDWGPGSAHQHSG